MTTDELVSLAEALIGDLDLAGARRGNGVAKNLGDDTFILLVRFLSGERPYDGPTASELRRTGAERYLNDRVSQMEELTLDWDDDDGEPAEVKSAEFEGVTLL